MFKILLSDIRPFRATTAGANSSGANTAFGAFALGNNVTGGASTAIGYAALYHATGGGNIALGDLAGVDVTTGSGKHPDRSPRSCGRRRHNPHRPQTQTKCFIAGVRGVTMGVGGDLPVVIDSASQLGAASSSKRFKKDQADGPCERSDPRAEACDFSIQDRQDKPGAVRALGGACC